ncbi:hypothetical protein [Neisseria sicca]|jgi:hypothetical protein|nr:hypothetical protein [Neisseria sicca]
MPSSPYFGCLEYMGRLKNRRSGFQTTFLPKSFIAETSQLLKNQL